MSLYVHSFKESDKLKLLSAGGKGFNLAELSKIKEISVPEGLYVSTEVYKKVLINNNKLNSLLDQLKNIILTDKDKMKLISNQMREIIENTKIPEDVLEEITSAIAIFSEGTSFAVRSSATAEDLPTASFAGQHDTYLNIIGTESIMKHIQKCWASLFTERAITYRIKNKFDHENVFLAVVVQKMIIPNASGIMFTADPVNGNRKVISIDASYGIGEALVSGLVNPDIYKVNGGKIVGKVISEKKKAIYPLMDGGTEERSIDDERRSKQTLTNEQIIKLAELGRKIEAESIAE